MDSSQSKQFSIYARQRAISVQIYPNEVPDNTESCTILGGSLSAREVFERYSKGDVIPSVGSPLVSDSELRCEPMIRDRGDVVAAHAELNARLMQLQQQESSPQSTEIPPDSPPASAE